MKQKIVLDTNVLVSALIAKSYPAKIINELVFGEKISLCLSQAVWEEYRDVLSRDKFTKHPGFRENAVSVLGKIVDLSIKFTPDVKYDTIKDPSDNKFLELAVFSGAEYLVTGNTRDFTFSHFFGVKIATPGEYWEKCRGPNF